MRTLSYADDGRVIAMSDSTKSGLMLAFVGLLVLVGLAAVVWHRLRQAPGETGDATSMTRPVLAILLVGTVVVLATASLTLADKETRNLLVGGVVSLASAAVAFYFASSGASEARRDLLKATGRETVPNLKGRTFAEAQALVSLTSLALEKPPDPVPPGPIVDQVPAPETMVPPGQRLTVTF